MNRTGMEIGERMDESVLARRVEGRHLNGGTLAEAIGDRPTVLVFLRHFG